MVRKSLLIASMGMVLIFLSPGMGPEAQARPQDQCPKSCPPGPRGARGPQGARGPAGAQGQPGPRGAADNIYFVHQDVNMAVEVRGNQYYVAQEDTTRLSEAQDALVCRDNGWAIQGFTFTFDMDNPPHQISWVLSVGAGQPLVNPIQKRIRVVQACLDFGAALE